MDTDYCVVLVTGQKKDGERIQEALVEERLAACVNSVSVSSVFSWKNRIERQNEVLLVIKTRKSLLDQVISRVKALHSYDVPEVVALPIIKGNKDYLKWLDEVTE